MENKNLTFGEATKLLKEGKAVRRKGGMERINSFIMSLLLVIRQ